MRRRNLITELLAAVLVGDGVLSFVSPRRYLLAVEFGPEGYRKALEELAERAPLTRLLALGQVGLGLFIASRGFPQEEEQQQQASRKRAGAIKGGVPALLYAPNFRASSRKMLSL